MFCIKSSFRVQQLLAVIIILSGAIALSPALAQDGVSIKGKVSVRGYEQKTWEKYFEKLEITLSGDNTGEAAQTVSDNLFTFEQVNPEDFIQILWIHDESTKATHVLFPFDHEGKASTLSNGLIRFRFRTMDWVLNEFKKRSSRAAIKGRIEKIDEIVTHAKQYHEILSESKKIDRDTIDRYMHKLLQHICQKSEEQRSAEKAEFVTLENIPVQRKWYVELLNITGDSNYINKYPAAFRRALNQWIVFTRQSYTKYNKWSDRNISFFGDIDKSFRDSNSRDMLNKDVILISTLLERNGYSSMKNYPFLTEGSVDMNAVSNWIAEINRRVKPLTKTYNPLTVNRKKDIIKKK